MIELVRAYVLPAAYALLPAVMASPDATRLVLAIGWQESRFQYRRQAGGPACGFWQFEIAGVNGVLSHPSTHDMIRTALRALQYRHQPTPSGCQMALEHNDVLAAVFARLLVWTLPHPIPADEAEGWRQYLAAWRPGKPHPDTWAAAWQMAQPEQET